MGRRMKLDRAKIIAHVLVEVASGRYVSRIIAEDDGMPDQATFWRWHFEDWNDLRGKLADARAQGVEALLDECGEIADDGTNDYALKPKKNEDDPDEYAFDRENVLRSKLRVETRIKMAQMLKPKTYGPKLDLTSGGEKLSLAAELDAARKRIEQ